ncbi:MAG: signal recognition particle-docking protein FtsY [Acidobacteriota bacterium]
MIGRILDGLRKTREALSERVGGLFSRTTEADDSDLEALEEALLLADVGLDTIRVLLDRLPREARVDGRGLRETLLKRMAALWPPSPPAEGPPPAPWVQLVVGVNGVGKTTTIGKIASQRVKKGQKGLLAAGDTFRAAAADQLEIWARRAGAGVVRQKEGADPAAVAYDAVQAAVSRGLDFVLVDTAGRLHVKHNLMEELAKIQRVCRRALPGAPHQVTLVLDATTGQNGLSQARLFTEKVGVTDLVLTKLDGTAKGGIALSIAAELGVPIRLVGVGERVEDLVPFDPEEYVRGLLA